MGKIVESSEEPMQTSTTASSDEPVTSSLESSDENVTKPAKSIEQEPIENSNENKDTSNLAAEIQASPKKNTDLGESKCYNMLPCLDSEIILVKQ